MRDYKTTMEVFNALSCILFASDSTGNTGYGCTIDTRGFADVLGVVTMGAVSGTAASTGELTVKFQESVNATGPFTDINDGAINGTMKITMNVKGHTAVTNPYAYMGKCYEKLGVTSVGGTYRLRYIRCHASLKGTGASGYLAGAIGVAVLLGRPSDTLYIQNPASIGSGNADVWQGWTVNSFKP